jgi:hypothetical protein
MAGWGTCRNCRSRIYWGISPYNSAKAFPFNDADEQQSHFDTCSAQEWITDALGQRHRVSTCKACHERVYWETTPTGKRRPMNIEGGEPTYECHFDTCMGVPSGAGAGTASANGIPREAVLDPRDAVHLWLMHLGLEWPVTMSQVTSAFRTLAMTHHPDMGGNTSDFIRVRTAYDRLKELMGALA